MNMQQTEKNKLYDLGDSLKKCRRADLSDIGDDDSLIENYM